MIVSELVKLLGAFENSGYGDYEVWITYESGCRGQINFVTIDVEKHELFIGE